jgi:hypothetical protein
MKLEAHRRPVFALAYTALGFLKATMSWEPEDIAEANRRTDACRALVAPDLQKGAWFSSPTMTLVEMEAALVDSEAQLLAGTLCFTSESVGSASALVAFICVLFLCCSLGSASALVTFICVLCSLRTQISRSMATPLSFLQMMSYIRGGLLFRSAFKQFEACAGQLHDVAPELLDYNGSMQKSAKSSEEMVTKEQRDASPFAALDDSALSGIYFGLGVFAVVISILPSFIMKIVSILGFPTNRAHGMRLLQRGLDLGGIRSPLCALTMLIMHVVIPGFFTTEAETNARKAQPVFDWVRARWPSSCLFLWNEGRQVGSISHVRFCHSSLASSCYQILTLYSFLSSFLPFFVSSFLRFFVSSFLPFFLSSCSFGTRGARCVQSITFAFVNHYWFNHACRF